MRMRPATPADVRRMMELARAVARGAPWSEAQFTRMFDDDSKRLILVLEIPERHQVAEGYLRIEGYAVAHLLPPECELETIVVNRELQRRGLGEDLLAELLNRVRGKGCEAVYLEVRESNLAARGLYEKLGFREVGRRVNYYAQPQEDAVLYRFSFSASASATVQI